MPPDGRTTPAREPVVAGESSSLITALAQSVKCVVAAAARIVGPHDPMLGPPAPKADDVMAAKNIIDHIFQVVPEILWSTTL